MIYNLERYLVDDFLTSLPFSPFAKCGNIDFITEFNYSLGRPDIIALSCSKEIIAFEAKLHRWRDALQQAYRNTCFAHYSYIVIPEETVKRTVKFSEEFLFRSVGICYLHNGEIVIAQEAEKSEPLQEWLLKRAIKAIEDKESKCLTLKYSQTLL